MARHRLEVALRVHAQIGADREPEVPAAAARDAVQNAPGELAALADARACVRIDRSCHLRSVK